MFYERPDGNYSLPVLWPAIPIKDQNEYEPLPDIQHGRCETRGCEHGTMIIPIKISHGM